VHVTVNVNLHIALFGGGLCRRLSGLLSFCHLVFK
jgi:hypothetical protein